jgi:hypothetical protein
MEREMSDGLTTSATLNRVREEDLLRFCDFCYTGTYTDPYPIVIKPSTPTIEPGTNNGNDTGSSTSTALVTTEDTTLQPPAAKRPRTASPAHSSTEFDRPGTLGASPVPEVNSSLNFNNKLKLRSIFENTGYTTLAPHAFGTTAKKTNGMPANENHTNVFIAHAAMYALAVDYKITKLETLSLQKLIEKLMRFDCKPERVGDVLALVRWVYNTERFAPRDMPGLKDLVARYVVSEVSGFGNTEEFGDLLEEGGGFVTDFWSMISFHLLTGGEESE